MIASATAAATRRLILVPAPPREHRGDATLRRYRLARLRLEGRDAGRPERVDHGKRCYD